MNEKPGGTPSPLNPNTSAAPAGVAPTPGNAQPVAPAAAQPTAAVPQPSNTDMKVAGTSTQATEVAATTSIGDQLSAELAKEDLKASDSVVDSKKKSKKGLIIALVILLLAAIGGAVAAILILKPFGGGSKDAVPMAISKLSSNEYPKNISMNGKITVASSDPSSSFANLDIDFNAGLNADSTDQFIAAAITATFSDESTFQFEANEVHVAGGDLYLKLSGIAEALDNYQAPTRTSEETNCLEDESGEINCEIVEITDCDAYDEAEDCMTQSPSSPILDYIGVFEVIDDEWIRVSGAGPSAIIDGMSSGGSTSCLIEAAGKLNRYGSDFSTMYQNNPFITYSTDNLKIAQKKDQLYLLGFDADKMAGFINSMSTSGFMNEMLACTNQTATNKNVTADDAAKIIAALPTTYVEIDDQNNFTRVYLTKESDNGLTVATADISFSYSSTITVDEPEEYLELNSVLTMLFSEFNGNDNLFEDTTWDYQEEIIDVKD